MKTGPLFISVAMICLAVAAPSAGSAYAASTAAALHQTPETASRNDVLVKDAPVEAVTKDADEPAAAKPSTAKTAIGKNTSGLPVPRFASLRSKEVNMRTGPGTRYPIDWVFVLQGLPVEITAEYDIWRRVRDPSGSEGWVNKGELSGKRSAIIDGAARELRSAEEDASPPLAHLESGAVGQLLSCTKLWCKVRFGGIKGYLRKPDFWGAYPDEVFD